MAKITNPTSALGERFLTAYVNLPFLKKLFLSAPDDVRTRPGKDWPEVWWNVKQFLQRSARIVVDAKKEEVLSEDSLVKFFFGDGHHEHVEFQHGLSETIVESRELYVEDPFSVFLLEHSDFYPEDLRSQTGLLFLQHDDLEKDWPRLFSENVLDVNDSSPPFRWTDLKSHVIPLNSMVVADRFAYHQFHEGGRSESFKENLGALLDALLPEGPLDDHFHLTLVTDLTSLWDKYRVRASDVEARLRSFVESVRPKLDVLLTASSYRESSSHKDRFVFTNYGLLTSNDSLHFFEGGEVNKETLVHYLPSSEKGKAVRRRLHRMDRGCVPILV